MLQKLNERIQGAIAWVVIGLVIITFALFGVDYFMQSKQASNAEIEVNGQPITKQAFEVAFRRERQQRELAQMSTSNELALKNKVLRDLISNEVTIQAARVDGFEVNVEQANAAILAIPQFQQDGRFSLERYQQVLSNAMFTPESFQKEVQQGMLLNQQRFAFVGTAFALASEVQHYAKLDLQTRDYAYLRIPISLFSQNNPIPAQQIKAYYQSHQKEFLTPEKVAVDYIRLSMKNIKQAIAVTPAQVQHYYDENQANFLTPAQWQVAHILFALPPGANPEDEEQVKKTADEAFQALQKDPTSFNYWVKTKSADKLSAAQNGVLPWLTAGQSPFDKTLATLTKPNEIAPPVKGPRGYEIFKLIQYKPATIKPFTTVESLIKEQLVAELAQARYAQQLEQLADLSYQNPDSLTVVAETLKLPIEHSSFFTRQGGDEEIAKNPQIVKAAFSHDVLELGNNSEPIQVDNDSMVVLRVAKHEPAIVQPLTAVNALIDKKLALQAAQQKAQQWGADWVAKKDLTVQEKWLQTNHLQWHNITQAARDSDNVEPMINELAFSLSRTDNRRGHLLENGDFVLIYLQQINDGQLTTLDKEQQASLVQQIEASFGLVDYDLYVSQLLKSAKIEKT